MIKALRHRKKEGGAGLVAHRKGWICGDATTACRCFGGQGVAPVGLGAPLR
jgi:hypothetical protein